MSKTINVILTGGVGSRLWPLSRKSQPKQYIPLFEGRSLFQLTAERNKAVAEHVIVVGNRDNHLLTQADLEKAEVENYTSIVEACPRNTAAAIAFAALAAQPDDVLIVTPSDHIIVDENAYTEAIRQAIEMARAGYLVTFGITPVKAETGYGYIEFEGNEVVSFREKPDAVTAQGFISQGCFLWNSGMFCFRAKDFLEELKNYEPLLYQKALQTWNAQIDGLLPENETLEIPSKSIDYAVMERSDKIKVIPAAFGWSDLGSFESLWEYFDNQGYSHHFKHNNLVLGTTQKHVEVIGVEGLVVVETKDAILVLPRQQSQDVKKIYERLEVEKPQILI